MLVFASATGILRENGPNNPIVPPVRVNTPQPDTFCLVSVFWIAEVANPTPPMIRVAWIARVTASFGW